MFLPSRCGKLLRLCVVVSQDGEMENAMESERFVDQARIYVGSESGSSSQTKISLGVMEHLPRAHQ